MAILNKKPRARVRALAVLAVIAFPAFGLAEDLRKNYTWILAEGLPPKLGLQPRNPNRRSMSYEHVFIECHRLGRMTISAWPAELGGRKSKSTVSMTLETNTEHYDFQNPVKSFNEMDSVWQISATTPDLTVARNILRASSIRLTGTGMSLMLPAASRDVDAFVRSCERFRG